MSEVDQDQVDPAMEMETAGTEVTETASNLNYWSGLLVQVRWLPILHSLDVFMFKLTNIYDEYSPPVVQVRSLNWTLNSIIWWRYQTWCWDLINFLSKAWNRNSLKAFQSILWTKNLIIFLIFSCWHLEVRWQWYLEAWCLTFHSIYKFSPSRRPKDSLSMSVLLCWWRTPSESYTGLEITLRLLCWSRAFWWTSPCSLWSTFVSRSATRSTSLRKGRVVTSLTLTLTISGGGQTSCPIWSLSRLSLS